MKRSFWENPFTPWAVYLGIGFGSIGLGIVTGLITGLVAGTSSVVTTGSAPLVAIGVVTLTLGLVPALVWFVKLKRGTRSQTNTVHHAPKPSTRATAATDAHPDRDPSQIPASETTRRRRWS